MQHTQHYLDTLDKQQRGELWVAGVLAKQPDYDVQDLQDIWEQTENTHETYEQEADKMKWLNDRLEQAMNSGFVEYDSIESFIKANDLRRTKIYEKMRQQTQRHKIG